MSLGYVTPAKVYDTPEIKREKAWKKRQYGQGDTVALAT
jgi:hypothetical protein